MFWGLGYRLQGRGLKTGIELRGSSWRNSLDANPMREFIFNVRQILSSEFNGSE